MFKALWELFLLSALSRRARYNRAHYPPMAVFAHDFIGMQIYVHGQYEKRELEFLRPVLAPLLNREGALLDIGANIGNHALYFAELSNDVHCFEPNPRTAALLVLNTAECPAITVHDFGLSDKAKTLEAFVPAANAGGARLDAKEGGDGTTIRFDLKRFDELPLAKKAVSVVKIDVEGHEADALEGMRNTLQRDWPLVLFECNRKSELEPADAAIAKLQDIGFDLFFSLMPARSVVSDVVPSLVRRPARALEFLLRSSLRQLSFQKVETFRQLNYPLILATKAGSLAGSHMEEVSRC